MKKPLSIRLHERTETYLRCQLAEQTKEVDLESVKGTREKLLTEGRKDKDRKNPAILALRAERADLKGLPMREGIDCQVPSADIKKMQVISRQLRSFFGGPARGEPIDRYDHIRNTQRLQKLLQSSKDWFQDDGLSTLAQMFAVEDDFWRGEFIERLKTVESAKASVLLARQALFDLSAAIRAEAVKALKDRPREEYRQVLLDGLRYPWAPVAAHAAEALVALNDREAVFPLADMLDEPDPCAPRRDKSNKWVVSEVVRINHLRNCLLCHAASTDVKDPLRGAVPIPGQRLPQLYYSSRKGDFVRADVTYLRQDFSLMEPVSHSDPWPTWQRFDYVVRSRELMADERAAHEKKIRASGSFSYPQRDAVLFALRELTGKNVGEDSGDWYDLLDTLETSAHP